ncbi:MAG: UDP-N-acetylmuramate dehydrogenase [Treponema sp.]|nr:UDP-N-acetylmuramate dehydrogenase [Treponema sp.]
MNTQEIIAKIKSYDHFKGKILLDEPLANKTTFKIGGRAQLFIKPLNYNSFQIVLDTLLEDKVPFFILGGGSNIVFTDQVLEKVVISTQDFSDLDYFLPEDLPPEFGKIEITKDQCLVSCFSGTPMSKLVNFCTNNNISGLEEFAGLPGSVGGALYMNARCFNKEISDILLCSSYMDFSSGKVSLKKCKTIKEEWAYKKSPYQKSQKFITTATFLLTQKSPEDKAEIESNCKKFIAERVSKGHFKYPSAGSVFKNNHEFGKPSGAIIDQAGLKGYQIGGAKIADFHGNFIINTGNAKAKDVKDLVQYTQKIIKEKYSFNLEPEIIFVDN